MGFTNAPLLPCRAVIILDFVGWRRGFQDCLIGEVADAGRLYLSRAALHTRDGVPIRPHKIMSISNTEKCKHCRLLNSEIDRRHH